MEIVSQRKIKESDFFVQAEYARQIGEYDGLANFLFFSHCYTDTPSPWFDERWYVIQRSKEMYPEAWKEYQLIKADYERYRVKM